MRTTIDAAGRVVVPKAIRDSLGLVGGEKLDVVERDGGIEIRPLLTKVTLIETEHGLAAVPERELPVLTDEIVRDTLERVRR